MVRTPVAFVDDVIAHESCHLEVMGHGREFERLLTRRMPDWNGRKGWLDARE